MMIARKKMRRITNADLEAEVPSQMHLELVNEKKGKFVYLTIKIVPLTMLISPFQFCFFVIVSR